MKAIVCTRLGPPEDLELQETTARRPGPGEVRLRLRAAALNFPDLLMLTGGYQVKPALPYCPGMEAAGEIAELGEGVAGWSVGDRVIVTSNGEPFGLYAQETTVPAAALHAIPGDLDFIEASGFVTTYATSYHALVDRGDLAAGEVLLVHGATGGVGTAAVEIGLALGATVIATGGDDGKLEAVRRMGAHHVINYRTEDIRERVKEITGDRGADVIYDPVGGEVFEASMRCVAKEGRILIIGATSGTYAPVKTNHILIKEISVIGVLLGVWRTRHPERHRRNLEQLGRWVEEGRLRPHVGLTFPLEQAAQALRALERREVVGKCVLRID